MRRRIQFSAVKTVIFTVFANFLKWDLKVQRWGLTDDIRDKRSSDVDSTSETHYYVVIFCFMIIEMLILAFLEAFFETRCKKPTSWSQTDFGFKFNDLENIERLRSDRQDKQLFFDLSNYTLGRSGEYRSLTTLVSVGPFTFGLRAPKNFWSGGYVSYNISGNERIWPGTTFCKPKRGPRILYFNTNILQLGFAMRTELML